MADDSLPGWMRYLDEEDFPFIRNFLLASGSLKELAEVYGVSYPTVRLRLDRLIAKIPPESSAPQEPFVELIRALTASGRIEPSAAQKLIGEFRATQTGE